MDELGRARGSVRAARRRGSARRRLRGGVVRDSVRRHRMPLAQRGDPPGLALDGEAALRRGSVARSASDDRQQHGVQRRPRARPATAQPAAPATRRAGSRRQEHQPPAGKDLAATTASSQRQRDGRELDQDQRHRAQRGKLKAGAPPPSGSARSSSSSTQCPSTSASAERITRWRSAGRASSTTSSGTA